MRADDELSGIYNRLMTTARPVKGAVEKIAAAERAWIAYRDAYIEARYPAEDKLAAYGSIFQMEVLFLHAELTRRQTDALRELLKHYQ